MPSAEDAETTDNIGNESNGTSSESSTVITIEPGRHERQWVDTSGGELRVLDQTAVVPSPGMTTPPPSLQAASVAAPTNSSRLPIASKSSARIPGPRLKLKRRAPSIGTDDSPFDLSNGSHPDGRVDGVAGFHEDEKPFDAGDFFFIPVGNGLYRKEFKYGIQSGSEVKVKSEPSEHSNGGGRCCKKAATESNNSSNGMSHGPSNDVTYVERSQAQSQSGLLHSHPVADGQSSAAQMGPRHHAPLIIAPMSMDGCSLAEAGISLPDDSVYDDIGNFSDDFSPAATQGHPQQSTAPMSQEFSGHDGLSPLAGGGTDFYNIYYAPSCVIPGECHCGDGCSCEGCPTHDPLHAKAYGGVVQEEQQW